MHIIQHHLKVCLYLIEGGVERPGVPVVGLVIVEAEKLLSVHEGADEVFRPLQSIDMKLGLCGRQECLAGLLRTDGVVVGFTMDR